jgi:hypothetical protein
MRKLLARLVVGFAATVVVVAGLEALRVRQAIPDALATAREGQLADSEPEPPPLIGTGSGLPDPKEAPSQPASPRIPSGMARVVGHVSGAEAVMAELEVTAQDLDGNHNTEVHDDGTFVVNLPPGNYAVVASAGNLVATAEVADLVEGEEREITLHLVEGATIAGRVQVPEESGARPKVSAIRTGTSFPQKEIEVDENGDFALEGLLPNRRYDLRFEADGLRPVELKQVVAPVQGITVHLEELAHLLGGFGLEPGQPCPMVSAELTSADAAQLYVSHFDRDCRFAIDQVSLVGVAQLRASGKGWQFDMAVTLPEHGDPPFLCLHGICRNPEDEPKASLRLSILQGPRERYVVTLLHENGGRGFGCGVDEEPCVLEDLPVTPHARVVVHVPGCESQSQVIDLNPGTNFLSVECIGTRSIEGVVRGGSAPENELTRVRCAGAEEGDVVAGHLFTMTCPERADAIEYQTGDDDTWHAAPIKTDGPGMPGLVEID